MSMKSSHTDALAGAAAVGDEATERSASAPLLVGSVMRRGSIGRAPEAAPASAPPQCVSTRSRDAVRHRRPIRFVAVTHPDPPSQPTKAPSRRLIWLLTVATGASVANLYYNQPLLSAIARTFDATPRATGAIA